MLTFSTALRKRATAGLGALSGSAAWACVTASSSATCINGLIHRRETAVSGRDGNGGKGAFDIRDTQTKMYLESELLEPLSEASPGLLQLDCDRCCIGLGLAAGERRGVREKASAEKMREGPRFAAPGPCLHR